MSAVGGADMGGTRRWGVVALLSLFAGSATSSLLFPEVLTRHCPLGFDALRPDRTVCELTLGGLWVSLAVALLAAFGALALGLGLAVASRAAGGALERGMLRSADAFFSLPDVLVLMVLQFAGQTLGELNPAFRLPPFVLMVVSLGLVGWAVPARVLHDRLVSLEQREFVEAARALGAGRAHIFRWHLWPFLKGTWVTLFLTRVPAAVLAESTVSFLGIGRMEPMSLGRYLGTSYGSLLYPGGFLRIGPAWALLVLTVLCVTLAARSGPPDERMAARR